MKLHYYFTLPALAFVLAGGIESHAARPNDKPTEKGKVRITTPEGCHIIFDAPKAPGTSLTQKVDSPDKLVQLAVNEPRNITLHKYSPIPSKNREAQEAAAREVAEKIAEMILAPEVWDSEDGLIRVQDVLSTTLGKLPEGALDTINSVLEADLSALDDPRKQPQYRMNTNNALAEMTRVITEYRQNGFDVNNTANFFSRLSRVPLVGGSFDKTGAVLRERFQTVKQAIDRVSDTLLEGVGQLRLRQMQMRQARLELQLLYRYLEISYLVNESLEQIMREYKEHNADSMLPETASRFDRSIMQPIVMSGQMIQRHQGSILTAYHQFRLLMDGNYDLIATISNLRATAKLEMSVFGAAKIIANEQRRMMNLAQAALEASDEMRKTALEQIHQQGIEIRAFPDKIITSTSQMIDAIDKLLEDLELAQQAVPLTIAKMSEANAELKQKLKEAIQKGARIDGIRLSDEINDQFSRKPSDMVDVALQ